MKSQSPTSCTPRSVRPENAGSRLTRCLRRAATAFTTAAALAQGTASAQYPNPNYSYLPYPTHHPYAPATAGACEPAATPALLPEDLGWLYDFDSPVDLAIREAVRGAYMRMEYILWDIEEPGSNLLGAPIANVADPRSPFVVQTASGSIGVAESLSTDRVDFNDINGIRGTVGVPFREFGVEGNIWGLANGEHTISDPEFLRNNSNVNPRFIAVGLLSDGQIGNRVLLFDRSFSADYKSSLWGGDINLYHYFKNPRQGLGLQPLAGFRFTNYDESLAMRGEFDNSSGAFTNFGVVTPFESRIKSEVQNNVYALQLGFKADFKHEFFTLAVEPKLALGANDYQNTVTTNDLRTFDDPTIVDGPNDLDDPPTRASTGRTFFSPGVDIGFSAKVHLTEWLHLRAGYNIMWTGGLARADRAIYYNDTGNANPPAIGTRQRTDSILVQGLSVGGEILLP